MFRDLFIFAVSLLFVASSVASQIPSFFDKKTAPRRVEQNTSQQVGAVVPNFTGHWTGTCQGEQIHLFSITIEQTGITFKITSANGGTIISVKEDAQGYTLGTISTTDELYIIPDGVEDFDRELGKIITMHRMKQK